MPARADELGDLKEQVKALSQQVQALTKLVQSSPPAASALTLPPTANSAAAEVEGPSAPTGTAAPAGRAPSESMPAVRSNPYITARSPRSATTFTYGNAELQISGGLSIALKHDATTADSYDSVVRTGNNGNNLTFRGRYDFVEEPGFWTQGLINFRFDPTTGGTVASGTLPASGNRFAENMKFTLGSPYGELNLGRFESALYNMRVATDFYKPTGFGTAAEAVPLDIPARENGMIEYISPTFRGVHVAFAYSDGHSQTTVNTTRFGEASISYQGNGLVVGVGYNKNGPRGNDPTLLAGKKSLLLTAGYDFKYFKLGVAQANVSAYGSTKATKRTDMSARIPITDTKFEVKLGGNHFKSEGSSPVDYRAAGVDYNWNPFTTISLEAARQTSDTPALQHPGVSVLTNFVFRF